jgi:hypothetical protein
LDYGRKKKLEAKIETAEMKFLRSIGGYTRMVQIINITIREN